MIAIAILPSRAKLHRNFRRSARESNWTVEYEEKPGSEEVALGNTVPAKKRARDPGEGIEKKERRRQPDMEGLSEMEIYRVYKEESSSTSDSTCLPPASCTCVPVYRCIPV